jgi:hypothetical protein
VAILPAWFAFRGHRGIRVTDEGTAEPARRYRDTIVAAACLGLVWPGDALIYVVLPL